MHSVKNQQHRWQELAQKPKKTTKSQEYRLIIERRSRILIGRRIIQAVPPRVSPTIACVFATRMTRETLLTAQNASVESSPRVASRDTAILARMAGKRDKVVFESSKNGIVIILLLRGSWLLSELFGVEMDTEYVISGHGVCCMGLLACLARAFTF